MKTSDLIQKQIRCLLGMSVAAISLCSSGCMQVTGLFKQAPLLNEWQAMDFTRHIPLVTQQSKTLTLAQSRELLDLIKDEKRWCYWELEQSRADKDYKNVRVCQKRLAFVNDACVSADMLIISMEHKWKPIENFWKCVLMDQLQQWYDFEVKYRPDWQEKGPAPMIVSKYIHPKVAHMKSDLAFNKVG
ncbi:MAG: hypothetical protein ACI4QM_05275 [Alphaproteobacteria bacterium]